MAYALSKFITDWVFANQDKLILESAITVFKAYVGSVLIRLEAYTT